MWSTSVFFVDMQQCGGYESAVLRPVVHFVDRVCCSLSFANAVLRVIEEQNGRLCVLIGVDVGRLTGSTRRIHRRDHLIFLLFGPLRIRKIDEVSFAMTLPKRRMERNYGAGFLYQQLNIVQTQLVTHRTAGMDLPDLSESKIIVFISAGTAVVPLRRCHPAVTSTARDK